MKILSKVKDYYDYIQAWGSEPGLFWNRESFYYWNDSPQEEAMRKYIGLPGRRESLSISLVIFCGELILRQEIYRNGKVETVWGDEVLLFLRRERVCQNLRRTVENKPNVLQMHREFNSPVITVFQGGIEVNPNLSRLGFDKYMSAEECFQRISGYLGLMKETDKPHGQTDKDKVLSHGFDAKRSFRPTMR